MADGGKVVAKKVRKKAPKPTPEMLGTGAAAKAGEAILTRQEKIDKALADAGA